MSVLPAGQLRRATESFVRNAWIPRHRVRAIPGRQLLVDVPDVRVRRLLADSEVARDLRCAESVGEQVEDLSLSRRQTERHLGRRGARAAEQPANAGQQLVWAEGLHEVVVGADHQARRSVERLDALARHHENRHHVAEGFPQLVNDLVPGDSVEGDVEDDEGGLPRSDLAQRVMAGAGFARRQSVVVEDVTDEGPKLGVVVHDEGVRRT